MKTALQTALATIAPSISIRTVWEPDPDCGPISKECDGFKPSEDNDWRAWQSEIRATAICNGEKITGSAHLGGTFERRSDNPAESNPTISGYEPQMTLEALEDLRHASPLESTLLGDQIAAACDYLQRLMAEKYAEQLAEIEATR